MLFIILVVMIWDLKSEALIPALLITSIMALVFGIGWYYRVLRYSLTEDTILVHRLSGKVELSILELVDTRVVNKEDGFRAIRTMGMGGLWGFWGRFYSTDLGHFKLYTTCWKPILFLHLKGKGWVGISPKDPVSIEKELRQHANLPDKE